jgi:iron complex transport system ATP-binding protein
MEDSLLDLVNIRFRYGSKSPWVLDGLSSAIPPGSLTAILGPNGAGKTTLLLLLIGAHIPASGDIRIDGRSIQRYSRTELSRRLALVPQSEQTPYPFSVTEYVSMGRAPHLRLLDMPDEHDSHLVKAVLGSLEIGELADRDVQGLSAGEAQLVRIARALVQEPDILLLDEPTAHLDLANKCRVLAALGELAGRNITVLFTTHDPVIAHRVATHAILLECGRAVAAGPVDAVLSSENLSRAYQIPVFVEQVNGRRIRLGR